MRYFRKALIFAPAFFSLQNVGLVTTMVMIAMPKTTCVEGLPNGRKGKDEDHNFFKDFTDKIPAKLKDDLNGLMGGGAGTLKGLFESGVPAQVTTTFEVRMLLLMLTL